MKTFHIYMCISLTKLEKKLFDGFPMLQTLNINYNTKLLEIDRDAFSNLKQLTSLDLSNNFYNSSYKINTIDSLDQMHFSAFINLKYFNLSHNDLKSIDENLFSNLPNLRVLNLSRNQLTVLDPKSFRSLKNLIWLNLDDNQLVQFDLCILDYIKEIKEISALENPIINKEEILARFKESKIEFKI
jgi:Leucine-rich repeat (LRR) protein